MNTLLRLLKKMRSRTQETLVSPCPSYSTEFRSEYAVHLMSQRLGCGDSEAIATIEAILREGITEIPHIIDCLRYAWDIPVREIGLSQRVNTRFYQTGTIVGFRGFVNTPARPIACEGCRNYCGEKHGGNTLVCAIYPYGPEESTCGDWEGEEGV